MTMTQMRETVNLQKQLLDLIQREPETAWLIIESAVAGAIAQDSLTLEQQREQLIQQIQSWQPGQEFW